MVMSRALSFMADPALAACVLPAPGTGFDIPAFLDDRGTVYLIAEAVSEEAPVAPLFAAMATEIHYIAAQLGQASDAGRLDPPLLMGLDEVTQICPVPLPHWLADSGGKGIQVVAVVHGEAQLAARWGEHGRQIVLDTCSVKVFLPGITDTTTLQAASTLCGQASWKVHGQDHATRHDVATPDMIRQLPAGFALVIRGGCAPVIARLPRAWKNPAYRRARRLGPAPSGRPGRSAPGHRVPRTGHPRPRARRVAPRRRHLLPLELTMTSNDPITAALQQLADHHEQLTQLDARESRSLHRPHRSAGRAHRPDHRHRPHAWKTTRTALARLEALDRQVTDLAAQLAPGPRRLPPRPSPGMVEAPGRRTPRTHRPPARLGRAGLPPWLRPPGRHPSAPAGPPTTCACTAWTSCPACGPSCTCSPAVTPGCCRPRPNTRPASCPPWPPS